MAARKDTPYVWLTWLIRLLCGEEHCRWHYWFKAHHEHFPKVESDFDSVTWNIDHAAMVNAHADTLRRQGYIVTVEKQNRFALTGTAGAVLVGQPDIVAVKEDELLLVDCKSGKPHPQQHHVQLLLYLHLWIYAHREHEDLTARGEIVYASRAPISVSAVAADDGFGQQFRNLIREIVAETEPARAPSYPECSRCDLTCVSCPAKVSTPIEAVHVDLF